MQIFPVGATKACLCPDCPEPTSVPCQLGKQEENGQIRNQTKEQTKSLRPGAKVDLRKSVGGIQTNPPEM